MGTTYTVNGKTVDVTDHAAVQALSADEYADLLTQTLRTPAEPADVVANLQEEQPEQGTGFIIMNPPSDASDSDSQ
jgi:hypothetical protein